MGSTDGFGEVFGKDALQVLATHLNDAEAELKLNVFVVDVDQVFDSLVNDVEGAANNINAHLAGAGDGNRVCVNRLETLLEDGLLTASGRDLLLTLVTVKMFLKNGIDDETGSDDKQNTQKSAICNV